MTMATERELAALLTAGLAGVADVVWGWKASEGASLPASLPLVTLQRVLANNTAEDQCEEPNPLASTSVQVHTWHPEYAAARALNTQVRGIVLAAGGWVWQAEADAYEPAFRAWRIAGDYRAIALLVE
jgi:hypothetical protein